MLTPHSSVRRAPLLLAALASGIAASESPRIGNSHRNVLLIISDDLRAEIDAPGFGCTAAKVGTCHSQHSTPSSIHTSTLVCALKGVYSRKPRIALGFDIRCTAVTTGSDRANGITGGYSAIDLHMCIHCSATRPT
eukprot:m.146700 g.146700  ORF g.146700 m.146700 type:complete len:136 (+) comp14155_c0_seq2:54-461(+)